MRIGNKSMFAHAMIASKRETSISRRNATSFKYIFVKLWIIDKMRTRKSFIEKLLVVTDYFIKINLNFF